MKHLADEALRFMEANNGQLENFTISGFPQGVKILYLGPSVSYIDDSNDTMTVVDGQPQVTRNADVAQALVVFEYQGEEYKLFSDHSTNNLQPWGNPSYIEE